jgi:hypothetical protein
MPRIPVTPLTEPEGSRHRTGRATGEGGSVG